MHDTSAEMEALQRKLIMERTPQERFRMGLSMCQSARRLVYSSIPEDLPDHERKVQYFLRVYGHEFDEGERERICESIREANR